MRDAGQRARLAVGFDKGSEFINALCLFQWRHVFGIYGLSIVENAFFNCRERAKELRPLYTTTSTSTLSSSSSSSSTDTS